MRNRIDNRFKDLTARGESALVTFITAGDPNPATTLACMHALVRGGADVIELGVPFSDPMADGPTIQRASERALAGPLDGRTVRHRIGEWNAEFDHVGTASHQRVHAGKRGCRVRVARGNERDQRAFTAGGEVLEAVVDPVAHGGYSVSP